MKLNVHQLSSNKQVQFRRSRLQACKEADAVAHYALARSWRKYSCEGRLLWAAPKILLRHITDDSFICPVSTSCIGQKQGDPLLVLCQIGL